MNESEEIKKAFVLKNDRPKRQTNINECFVRTCTQTVTGRNLRYDRALQVTNCNICKSSINPYNDNIAHIFQ